MRACGSHAQCRQGAWSCELLWVVVFLIVVSIRIPPCATIGGADSARRWAMGPPAVRGREWVEALRWRTYVFVIVGAPSARLFTGTGDVAMANGATDGAMFLCVDLGLAVQNRDESSTRAYCCEDIVAGVCGMHCRLSGVMPDRRP